MHQTNSVQVKSALGEREATKRFTLLRTVRLVVHEIPDVTGPVRKVSSWGGVPWLFSATVRQWAAPRGAPAPMHCFIVRGFACHLVTVNINTALQSSGWFTINNRRT